jgi:hypothetical protein
MRILIPSRSREWDDQRQGAGSLAAFIIVQDWPIRRVERKNSSVTDNSLELPTSSFRGSYST